MSKDYNKSDYGINKYSKGIVYRYSDGSSLEITYEMIAAGNPEFTRDKFDEIKAVSDSIYHKEAKKDCLYNHYKVMPLLEEVDNESISTLSLEEELMRRNDKKYFAAKIQETINSKLTPTQKKRLILHIVKGLSTYEIARIENTNQKSIYESIAAAKEKIKKIFINF